MKILTGKVVSNKMSKTLVVVVVRSSIHPLYKKILKRRRRYKVHSEDPSVNIGDRVKFVETKPISRDKYFKLVEKL